jgi:hypothetical protein
MMDDGKLAPTSWFESCAPKQRHKLGKSDSSEGGTWAKHKNVPFGYLI